MKKHKLAQLNSQRIKKPAGLDAAHVKTRSGRNDDDEEEAVSASATVAVVAQYDAEYEMKLKKVSTRAGNIQKKKNKVGGYHLKSSSLYPLS